MRLAQTTRRAVHIAVISVAAFGGMLALASWKMKTHAQNQASSHVRVSAVTDWSHRHMVYSHPSSVGEALQLQSEPRYMQQLVRRNAAAPQSGN